MSTIEFTKMTAIGNDFVILDNRGGRAGKKIDDFTRFARVACARKRSIGADGLLLLEDSKDADITMRIFNPDGSEVSMCGNGSRCMAYYAVKKGVVKGNTLSIETKAGILKAEVSGEAAKIEMTQPASLKRRFPLKLSGRTIEASFINTGVPHVVSFVEDLSSVDVKGLGREIRGHRQFAPEGTNADFVEVKDKNTVFIRTYERGVEDETLACGTGAVATAVIAAEYGYVEPPVKVKTWGGDALYIYFRKSGSEYKEVFLEGEVRLIYNGGIDYV
jgi:diaminopimelate epimerase